MKRGSNAGQRFEEICLELLKLRGFLIEDSPATKDENFDAVVAKDDKRWVVEIRYYRTARAQLSLVGAAIAQIVSKSKSYPIQQGMLIVSCELPSDLRKALFEVNNVRIIDRIELLDWGTANPKLFADLDSLLEVDASVVSRLASRPPEPVINRPLRPNEASSPDRRGTELCGRLRNHAAGRLYAQEYEQICQDVLRYLFPHDLYGWHDQYHTTDGSNRFDFICRMKSRTDFWSFLIQQLGSQYILFEFKNYSEKITQGQILTTEKYLLEKALRRVAIIFTRRGANKIAKAMAQGAMREHGKLMLVVDDDDVCKMLHMRQRANDPSDFLYDLADDFLMSLPR